MDETVIEALQVQLNKEAQNAQVYRALSAAFEKMNLSGFAAFMYRNALEEETHSKLFFDFLSDNGIQPRIDALQPCSFDLSGNIMADSFAIFQAALDAEKANKEALYAVDAAAESDAATEGFLIPIIQDQVKSIREFEEHVTKLTLAQGDGAAILLYDAKLGEVN